MRFRELALLVALLPSCAPKPVTVATSAAPAPAPTPQPTQAPTPPPAALPSFVDVPEPRLDVGLAIERTSFALPAGDWLLRSAAGLERRRGPLVFSSRSTGGAPLWEVQAGSFLSAEAAEASRARLAGLLGVPARVAEGAGRFSVRVGSPVERKGAEELLARVRRETAPDAFLVGAAPPPQAPSVLVEERSAPSELPSPVAIAAVDGSPLPVGEAAYRGHLLVRATGRGTIHVINRVNLEDYVKGVVPGEMGPRVYDELEALKAQAVAARTYAVRRRGDFAAEGYDLCATPRCQVYGGASAEQPLSSRAADETSGELLLYGGRAADALFTSTCGGHTESAAAVFPSYEGLDVPYLSPAACFGEKSVRLVTSLPAGKPVSPLGLRGWALLAALGRKDEKAADLQAARRALRDRLGLAPDAGPRSLAPAAVYADAVEAAGVADLHLLVEPVELTAAPAGWPEAARLGYAFLLRFQLGGGTSLPKERTLRHDEVAGLWALLLTRLGDLEEVEARFVALEGGEVVLKGPKGRARYALAPAPSLFSGGPDVYVPEKVLDLYPGDRVRAFVRDGAVAALAAPAGGAAGLYDRDSSWIHWIRRATGAELAARVKERDPARRLGAVRRLEVLERGTSGRVRRLRVTTDQGTLVLVGLEIRFSLGLPETLFTIVAGRSADGQPLFSFYGRGWGHGVGLCQNGAFGMALAGHGYREILSHYYAGTSVGVPPTPAAVSSGIR